VTVDDYIVKKSKSILFFIPLNSVFKVIFANSVVVFLMSYFPAFLKLTDKKILIVGGGKIAFEKLAHLLDFTTDITVVAPQLNQDMQSHIEK